MDRNRARHRPSQVTQTFVVVGLLLLLVPQLGRGQTNTEQLVDRVVAVVNSNPILHSEIESKVERGQTVILSPFPAAEDAPEFQKALQDQINFELVLQRVDELELSLDESEIDAEIKKFLKNRSLTLTGLQEALAQQGMTYSQYKEDFADQMIIRKFQGRVINPLIKITDKDLESYYLKKVGSTSDNVSLKLRQIYIKLPGGASEPVVEATRERAREVFQKIKDGTDFTEAAKIYSDLPGATENAGEMPAIQLNDLAAQIRDQIAPLSVGEYTQPIETPAGFYIFYLENKQFAGSNDFAKQKERLEFELRSEELVNQTKKWLIEQRRRSKIKLLD